MRNILETYLAAAYWGPRNESVHQCASRASEFLRSLSDVSTCLSEWRSLGRSRSRAVNAEPLELSSDRLATLFAAGQNRRDTDNAIIDELGFHIGLWNGQNDETVASLSLRCGLYSPVAGLSNAVVITLPPAFDTTNATQLKALVSALVNSWDPDWAIVASQTSISAHRGRGPFLDKALYVASSIGVPKEAATAVLYENLEHGSLLIASEL